MTRDRADDTWVGTATAAEVLGVVPRTVYRFIDSGDLPAYKMGRVLRLRRSDLDTYLERFRVQPGDLSHLYPNAPDPADPARDQPDPGDDGSSESPQ